MPKTKRTSTGSKKRFHPYANNSSSNNSNNSSNNNNNNSSNNSSNNNNNNNNNNKTSSKKHPHKKQHNRHKGHKTANDTHNNDGGGATFYGANAIETDPRRISQREKQIQFGKNTIGYTRYVELVPRHQRNPGDPQTPRADKKQSKRAFAGAIKAWRRFLHTYDMLEDDTMEEVAAQTMQRDQEAAAAAAATGTQVPKSEQSSHWYCFEWTGGYGQCDGLGNGFGVC